MGCNCRTTTPNNNLAFILAIEAAFYTTQHNDETIAQNVTSQSIPTTCNQVKQIRLAHDWRQRAHDEVQLAEDQTKTFDLVEQVLQQGECCFFGRELLRTYLRIKFVHNARDDTICDALHHLDQKSTESCQPGPKKKSTRR